MRPVVLSGCCGGGKTSLIDALMAQGYSTVTEPGRRVVREGLSWTDTPRRFAERLVELAIEDLADVRESPSTVFFDRGLIDAAVALEHAGGPNAMSTLDGHAFEPTAFMLPPWPELYRRDAARQHGYAAALDEYHRLSAA